jgi:hemoglobin
MDKRSLSSQEDVSLLIDSFYEKVLKHPELSYYFSEAIHNWPFHKDRFMKYWSKQILFEETYEGTPLHQHVAVDQRFDRGFKKEHFDEWTRVWIETVDELFEGPKAELAKESAANMAKNIYHKMFFNRSPQA